MRWDGALWARILEGPARELAAGLEGSGPPQEARALLESYLRLAAEGIGLGYLFPEEAGASSFLNLAWTRLLPRQLPRLSPPRRAARLAECWNLGENLDSSPLWLRRIFLRLVAGLEDLDRLEALVADVSRRALEPPPRPLGARFEPRWIHLAEEDARFLPGALHFLAPTVVCVHDRHRGAEAGRDAATLGVWLEEEPLGLGPMGCAERPEKDPGLRLELLEELARRDRRAGDWHAVAANDWRAAVSLETSQFLVGLLPA